MNACAAKDFYSAILELFGYSFYFDSLQATKTCVTGIAFKELHKSLLFVFDKPFLKEKKNFDFCFLFGINFNKEISNQIPKKQLFWGFRFILSKTSFIWQNKHPMSFIQNWIPHFWLKELFWTNLFIFSPKRKIKRQWRFSKSFAQASFKTSLRLTKKRLFELCKTEQRKKAIKRI